MRFDKDDRHSRPFRSKQAQGTDRSPPSTRKVSVGLGLWGLGNTFGCRLPYGKTRYRGVPALKRVRFRRCSPGSCSAISAWSNRSWKLQPVIQRVPGPHSISLLAHARMGGKHSEAVLEYLHALKDADVERPIALTDEERTGICGTIRASLASCLIRVASIRRGAQQNKREQADALLSR